MKKFYLANGTEIHLGDVIRVIKKSNHPLLGKRVKIKYRTIDEQTLSDWIKEGIVIVNQEETTKPANKDSAVPMELDFYIQKIANRLNWKIEKVYNYLNNIDAILPAAAFSIILREIAIELDKQYENHIEESSNIYVISMFDGRITKANKAHIKNYKNFAAFRSVEDARIACSITKDILKDLFKSEQ